MNEELAQELERISGELAAAEAEAIRLQARIQGMRAERDSLAAALATQRSETSTELEEPIKLDAIKKRTEAIEALLRRAGRAMTIDEVRDALNAGWREESNYAVVASTLNLLHRTGRISKVARGRYVAA